jgi:hypothetical protein
MPKCEGDTYIPGDMFVAGCGAVPTRTFRGRAVCEGCEKGMRMNENREGFRYEDRSSPSGILARPASQTSLGQGQGRP